MSRTKAALVSLIDRVGADPLAMARLASVFLARDEIDKARELLEQSAAQAPDNGEVLLRCRELLSRDVGPEHFGLVRDQGRHKSYDAVFRRRIGPGDLVVDLGGGTGLLAMMAARAGAVVVTCEER